jgi:hypothetical protein
MNSVIILSRITLYNRDKAAYNMSQTQRQLRVTGLSVF